MRLTHGVLGVADERDHVGGRRVTEVDHDVCVNVRDMRVSNAMTFEPALIDKTTSADPFSNQLSTPGLKKRNIALPKAANFFLVNVRTDNAVTDFS